MRVLMTGCKPQYFKRGARAKFRAVSDWVDETLVGAGFTVERREVVPGEYLSEFDLSIVGLMPFNAIGASSWYGSVWALGKSERSLALCGDWRVADIISSIRRYLPEFEKRAFNPKLTNRSYREEGLAHSAELKAICLKLYEQGFPKTILPLFPWWRGNEINSLKVRFSGGIVPIDFSPFVHQEAGSHFDPREMYPEEDRQRRWILDALSDVTGQFVKSDFTWPIFGAGHESTLELDSRPEEEKLKDEEGNQKKQILSFDQIYDLYQRSLGVLGFAHKHSGLGWWRQRPCMAVASGAIYSGDGREAEDLGEAFRVDRREVESRKIVSWL
jgi:hypothetical protein